MRWQRSWVDLTVGVSRGAATRARGPARAARRPSVECLEDRTVPGFLAPVDYAVGQYPVAVVTGDFNGDRQPDVVALSSSDRTVSLLLNNGGGTFQAARTFFAVPDGTSWSADSIAVGDVNGDGKLDLVTANRL